MPLETGMDFTILGEEINQASFVDGNEGRFTGFGVRISAALERFEERGEDLFVHRAFDVLRTIPIRAIDPIGGG